ncbi:MAG TPA: hypothetical protein PLI45_00370 [Candidatus Woesebacteria bacterium]|nr:hypothetical protein [Candidatus Woesebacteria bacterium]
MSTIPVDKSYLLGSAKIILDKLQGKTFDVISFHSGYKNCLNISEERQLKSEEYLVIGSLVKIPLKPSRSLSFDVRENPEITIESERQIKIVRHLSPRDTVTRIILINGEVSEGDR